jgi:hypothetical protein
MLNSEGITVSFRKIPSNLEKFGVEMQLRDANSYTITIEH